jgi:allantoinase
MTIVIASRNVVLPGCNDPEPATISIDKGTGKIINIQKAYLSSKQLFASVDEDATYIDAGNKYILPGLVE